VDAVLAEELHWFPVRHHSPAAARHLRAAMLARRPKLVLIEGPAEAGELIPHIIDDKTKPPVAIYCSYRDDAGVLNRAGVDSASPDIPPRYACWYPLTEYSPEFVAIRTAARLGAEIRFIDLPSHALIEPIPVAPTPAPAPVPEQPKPDPNKPDANLPDQPGSARDERLITESGFYAELARAAGYRSWDEAWDTLFEIPDFGGDPEAFRRELATFCAAARATTSLERIAGDGTRERERFMMRAIRAALSERKVAPRDATVVCGGFHLFLDRDDAVPPPTPPAGTVYTTVVPYSYFRISELSGYGAGNRAPQYHRLCWEAMNQDGASGPTDVSTDHIVAILKRARKRGEAVSAADSISATHHARMLASLRGRPAPSLDDIHDALFTCCCKGDPTQEGALLREAIDAEDIGTRVGKVTPALGRLPLVNDFYGLLSELELEEIAGKEKQMRVEVDKRDPRGARRSAFLHRLLFLEVPVGALVDAPSEVGGGTVFRETWALRWSPKLEPALVEKNLYGDTVEAAAIAKLREELARDGNDAGQTCGRLVRSVEMDLPDLVREIQDACGQAVDADARLVSLATALTHLLVLDRHASYRNLRRDAIEELVVRCYGRACFALAGSFSAPDEEHPAIVDALQSLAEPVLQDRSGRLDRNLLAHQLRAGASTSVSPFLRGAFTGLLVEMREMEPTELADVISAYARTTVDEMIKAGEFLDGVMAVSRTSIMLGAGPLVKAIDELLRSADHEAFLILVPRMRAAFERLHDRQRESLAVRVAEHYGLSESTALTELRTSAAAATVIARIDAETSRIMEQWGL